MKWEYKTVQFEILNVSEFDINLNKLGNDEWELVSIFTPPHGYGSKRTIAATFKKIIKQNTDDKK